MNGGRSDERAVLLPRSALAPPAPSKPLVAFADEPDADLVATLVEAGAAERGAWTTRRFPDGESYCRIESPVAGRDVLVAMRLDRPDPKLFALLLAADALRDAGAARVLLAAPYLPYLRQDERFLDGEGISSRTLARLVRSSFDGLVTVDPHLHRTPDLRHLFGDTPALAVASTEVVARHVAAAWPGAVVVGPDDESAQWVAPLAQRVGADWTTMDKVRTGDRDVAVSGGVVGCWDGRDVVLVDDIISTGRTLAVAAARIRETGGTVVGCVATHALFAPDAMPTLLGAGIEQVVTTTAVVHPTNGIDVAPLLAHGMRLLLDGTRSCTTT